MKKAKEMEDRAKRMAVEAEKKAIEAAKLQKEVSWQIDELHVCVPISCNCDRVN